jgi:hypothetical protein
MRYATREALRCLMVSLRAQLHSPLSLLSGSAPPRAARGCRVNVHANGPTQRHWTILGVLRLPALTLGLL